MSSEENALTPDDQIIGDDTTQTVDTSAKADEASESGGDDQAKGVQPPEAIHVKADLGHQNKAEPAETKSYIRGILNIVVFIIVITILISTGLTSTGSAIQAQQSMTIPRDHFPLHGSLVLAVICLLAVFQELILLRRPKDTEGKREGETFTYFSRGILFVVLTFFGSWLLLSLGGKSYFGSVHSLSVDWFKATLTHPIIRIAFLIIAPLFAVIVGRRASARGRNLIVTIILFLIMLVFFVFWDGSVNSI